MAEQKGNTLTNLGAKVVADVVRAGSQLIIPENVTIDQAVELLKRRKQFEEEKAVVSRTIDVFPWDGAVALEYVLEQEYGWCPAVPTPGFFSDNPPQLIGIKVSHNETRQVPWGRFKLPNVDGHVDTSVAYGSNERIIFRVVAEVKRKNVKQIERLFDLIEKRTQESSIYRGKALKIRFNDDEGDAIALPTPEFLDTTQIDERQLVYSRHVAEAVNTNLFTPIRRCQECLANGIPLKRGVLLGGTYGTGKTLAAMVASKIAVDVGVTYVYTQRADELKKAIEFAKQYQSPAAVVFVEDIDREISGERDVDMDDVLNTIDGIDGKNSNIIVVLTTNNLSAIHPAMLRPGRLDAVIEVTPPDAEAVERLLRLYGGAMIASDADLTEVGRTLTGNNAAVVEEVVKRAKLSQLALQAPGSVLSVITPQALLASAKTMTMQLELMRGKPVVAAYTPFDEGLIRIIKEAVRREDSETVATHQDVGKLTRYIQEKLD